MADGIERSLGFYVHVPFCASRCGYCDFNTYTAAELGNDVSTISRDSWVDYALSEVSIARRRMADDARAVSSVFVGGGTPTQVPAAHLVRVLERIGEEFGLAAGAEITTEANPDSTTAEYLEEIRAGGFTRISLGHQSSAASVLKVLERTHTPGRTWETVAAAKAAGFEHVNVDLIYSTPGETDADLRQTLDEVLASGVNHVSAYSLIVEDGTRLAAQMRRGELPMPDDDVAAARYEMIDSALTAAGMPWYELSNWAKPGGQCQHNIGYWRNHDWWGVGPGAHSHVGGVRWWNQKHPATWARAVVAGDAAGLMAGSEVPDAAAVALETVMLGVRMREGLPLHSLDSTAQAALTDLVARGLIEPLALIDPLVVLTLAGRLMADAVVRELTA